MSLACFDQQNLVQGPLVGPYRTNLKLADSSLQIYMQCCLIESVHCIAEGMCCLTAALCSDMYVNVSECKQAEDCRFCFTAYNTDAKVLQCKS